MAEQKMRFTDSELDTIKALFAEREDLLKLLRKVFQFAELTDTEQELIKKTFDKESIRVVRKSFLPELEMEAPISQVVDLWMTVDLKDKDFGQAVISLKARAALIDLLEEGMKRLKSPVGVFKALSDFRISKKDDNREEDIVNLIARNTLISHIEQQLYQLKMLAGQKDETVEQTRERLMKNSSK